MAIRTIDAERGFTLLELLVCVGLIALAGAATLGAVAGVLREAVPDVTRDAALMVADNALARARAAAAYVPRGTGIAPSDAGTAGLLSVGSRAFVAGAELRAPAVCGAATPRTLRLAVRTSYENGTFTVTVTYPRDPCDVDATGAFPDGDTATAQLRETFPPPLYLPGHVIPRTVGVPARM